MQMKKIDSKGRISIPSSVRSFLGIEEGDKFIVTAGKKDIKLLPMSSNGNIEMQMRFASTDALVGVMDVLSKNKIRILRSSSSGDRWRAVLDAQGTNEKKIAKEISDMKDVLHVKTRSLNKNKQVI